MKRHAATWMLIAAIFSPLAGCGSGPAPEAEQTDYDSAKAQQVLVAALESWKANKRAAFDGNRPIRLVDDDRAAGWQLVSFQIVEATAPIAAFQEIRVNLTLRNQRGDTTTRKATYQVTLDPELAVLRAES